MREMKFLVLVVGLTFVLVGCQKPQQSSLESATPEDLSLANMDNAVTTTMDEDSLAMQASAVDGQMATASAPTKAPTIKDIQQALQNAGLYQGSVDGVKGNKTNKAIKAFQAQNSLKVDGKVGAQTWRKLYPYLTTSAQPAASSDYVSTQSTSSN